VIPRDLRAAVIEATGQKEQLVHAKRALARVNAPIHMIHGDKDDFAPIEVAERLARESVSRRPIRFQRVAGAKHFLNDGPPKELIAALEACIPAEKRWTFRWPQLPKLVFPKAGGLFVPQTARAEV
jgi:pimeloyl-ACP methyl ester carboxylesterase